MKNKTPQFKRGDKVRIIKKPYFISSFGEKFYISYLKIGEEYEITGEMDFAGDYRLNTEIITPSYINRECLELVEEKWKHKNFIPTSFP